MRTRLASSPLSFPPIRRSLERASHSLILSLSLSLSPPPPARPPARFCPPLHGDNKKREGRRSAVKCVKTNQDEQEANGVSPLHFPIEANYRREKNTPEFVSYSPSLFPRKFTLRLYVVPRRPLLLSAYVRPKIRQFDYFPSVFTNLSCSKFVKNKTSKHSTIFGVHAARPVLSFKQVSINFRLCGSSKRNASKREIRAFLIILYHVQRGRSCGCNAYFSFAAAPFDGLHRSLQGAARTTLIPPLLPSFLSPPSRVREEIGNGRGVNFHCTRTLGEEEEEDRNRIECTTGLCPA